MTITELIEQLEELRYDYGNLDLVKVHCLDTITEDTLTPRATITTHNLIAVALREHSTQEALPL